MKTISDLCRYVCDPFDIHLSQSEAVIMQYVAVRKYVLRGYDI